MPNNIPQPVSHKKYFLLACLIVVVLLVAGSIAMTLLGSFVGVRSNSISLRNSGTSGIMAPQNSSFGFGGADSKMAQSTDYASPEMSQPHPGGGAVVDVDPADRKIIKSGTVSIVAKNVEETAKQVEAQATSLGGYVSSSSYNNYGDTKNKSGYTRVRVPAEKVTDFVNFVKGKAVKVTSENINSDDVTAEYVDLDARIKNLEAGEAEYRKFMERATKVEEILNVQRELTNIRGQIEQLKAQQNYLNSNSAMSDITINIAFDESELPIEPKDRWEPENVFKAAVRGLVATLQNLSYIGIFIAVYAVIWVPIGVGLFFFYKFLKNKIK
jgi:hypothetical protein